MEKKFAEYLLEKTKADYNLIAEHFSRAREKFWPEMKFLIENYTIPGEKILDLGCGNGRLFKVLKEKEIDYIGVDFSERLIKIAKRNFPEAKFQVTNVLDLPFPSNFFDKIFSIAVLHHIPSLKFRLQFLKEAKRVLKPKGLLILTVWDLWPKYKKEILKFVFLKLIGKSKLDFFDIQIPWMGMKDCYFHCFSRREFENLVKNANFKIRESGTITVPLKKRKYFNFYSIAEKI
jgi:ubiquinone/menaquinone biosynthesis C-methylase UbiE